ncbi:nucleotidyl transferase AbiEii/AbiGii toxin family protein [Isoptericola croceus]|uniref:nucleotidyl transferase AbiEii/AbiGii toxin family protein n=1 Tax=Isoptericola croceus TaxID=3031406 RepID=UPI0023FA3167|nr:nucleotidyl transferase AbiEii/AbiGii toxin family protein [Isoptericola croceus]
MLISVDGEELVVDLAVDAQPRTTPTLTILGPTITTEESAGQKMLALFGRAAPRDFADVYALSERFTKDDLIRLAQERDPGFEEIGALREFFDEWHRELAG